MEKWTKIRNATLIILIIFLSLIIIVGLGFLFDDASSYPDPIWGLSKFDAFCIVTAFIVFVFAIPVLVSVILLIVSLIILKVNKHKQNNENQFGKKS